MFNIDLTQYIEWNNQITTQNLEYHPDMGDDSKLEMTIIGDVSFE